MPSEEEVRANRTHKCVAERQRGKGEGREKKEEKGKSKREKRKRVRQICLLCLACSANSLSLYLSSSLSLSLFLSLSFQSLFIYEPWLFSLLPNFPLNTQFQSALRQLFPAACIAGFLCLFLSLPAYPPPPSLSLSLFLATNLTLSLSLPSLCCSIYIRTMICFVKISTMNWTTLRMLYIC